MVEVRKIDGMQHYFYATMGFNAKQVSEIATPMLLIKSDKLSDNLLSS